MYIAGGLMTDTKHPKLLEQAEAVLKLAHKYGALELQVGEISVKLSPVSTSSLTEKDLKAVGTSDMPSDEDLLLWSAGGALPSEERKASQDNE